MPALRLLYCVIILLLFTSCQIGSYKAGVVKTASLSVAKLPKQLPMPQPINTTGRNGLVAAALTGIALGATVPYSPASAYGLGAAIGSSRDDEYAYSPRKTYQYDFLAEHLRNELHREISDRLNKTGILTIVKQGAAQSTLSVKVKSWGFSSCNPLNPLNVLSSKLTATCSIEVELKANDGTKLWKSGLIGSGPYTYSSKLPKRTQHELRTKPELRKTDISNTARLVAEDLAKTLQKAAAHPSTR